MVISILLSIALGYLLCKLTDLYVEEKGGDCL